MGNTQKPMCRERKQLIQSKQMEQAGKVFTDLHSIVGDISNQETDIVTRTDNIRLVLDVKTQMERGGRSLVKKELIAVLLGLNDTLYEFLDDLNAMTVPQLNIEIRLVIGRKIIPQIQATIQASPHHEESFLRPSHQQSPQQSPRKRIQQSIRSGNTQLARRSGNTQLARSFVDFL